MFAGVVELVDTRDLKSLGSDTVPVRARSPAPSGVFYKSVYRGVEQLAARRAHNPEVVGSSPTAATRTRKQYRCHRLKAFVYQLFAGFLCPEI